MITKTIVDALVIKAKTEILSKYPNMEAKEINKLAFDLLYEAAITIFRENVK